MEMTVEERRFYHQKWLTWEESLCKLISHFKKEFYLSDYSGSLLLHGLFSSFSERGLLSSWVHELLIAEASLVEHSSGALEFQQLQHRGSVAVGPGLRGTGSVVVAQGLSCPAGMWGLPGSGMEPKPPALAGGFFTMQPPGEPKFHI